MKSTYNTIKLHTYITSIEFSSITLLEADAYSINLTEFLVYYTVSYSSVQVMILNFITNFVDNFTLRSLKKITFIFQIKTEYEHRKNYVHRITLYYRFLSQHKAYVRRGI
jgi:hypothetical protein